MSYQPPPSSASPAPAGKPRLRGRILLRLAIVFGVLGVAGAIVGGVLLRGVLTTIDDFARVPVDGQVHSVTLDAGKYVGYYESPGGKVFVRMAMADSSGKLVDLGLYGKNNSSSSTLTYDRSGRHGQAVFKFDLDSGGTYQVRAQIESGDATPEARMAFGKSIAGQLGGGAASLVVGIVLILVAVVLLIIGLVRRSRHKKQLANASAYGYPPPPGSGYGPPPGYGTPGGGYGPPPNQPPGYGPPSGGGYAPPPGGYPPQPPPT